MSDFLCASNDKRDIEAENKLNDIISKMSIAECEFLIKCRVEMDWDFIHEHRLFKNAHFNSYFIFQKLEQKYLNNDNNYRLFMEKLKSLENEKNTIINEIYKLEQKLLWNQN